MGAEVLFERLRRVRRRERLVSVGAGVFRTLLVALGLVAGFFVLDWLILSRTAEGLESDRLARAVLVLAMAATFAWVFWKNVWQELTRRLDDDLVALRVERRHPELRGRLISTIQLVRAGKLGAAMGSQELIKALEEDTVSFAQAINFFDVINISTLKKVAAAALGFLALATGLAVWRRDYAAALLGRMLLARATYPTAARISSLTPGGIVPRGENWAVELGLDPAGYVPESARLLVRPVGAGEVVEYGLTRVAGDGPQTTFRGVIERVMEDVEYTAVAHDARWMRWERLRVLKRPAIKSLELLLKFPEYSRLPDAARSAGDVQALAGTRVRVLARTSKPVVEARMAIRLGRGPAEQQGQELSAAMEISSDGTAVQGWFTVERDGYYKILLKDSDGLTNANPIEYVINAVEDRPPSVNITFPARDKTVTRFAKWPIRFEAKDDFGILRGWLKCRVASAVQLGQEAFPIESSGDVVSFQLTGLVDGAQRHVRGEVILDLEKLDIDVGRRLIYWIELEDNKTPEPNIGRSREYEMVVATAEEVMSLIGASRDEVMGRIEMLRKREQENKEGVERIWRGLSPGAPADGGRDRRP